MRTPAATALLIFAAGCLDEPSTGSVGGGFEPEIDGGTVDAAPPCTSVDGGTSVGPMGAVLTGEGATLAIPAGALRAAHDLTIRRADRSPPLPVGTAALSPVFELLPTCIAFATPATLTIPIPPTTAPATMLVAPSTEGPWKSVASGQASGTQAVASLTRQGLFVVVMSTFDDAGAPDAPGGFDAGTPDAPAGDASDGP